MNEELDCLVIGAGPAGLTAGIYLQRFRRKVMVCDAGSSRAARIPVSHNLPGFPEGIPGLDLLQRLRRQYTRFGGAVMPAEVARLEPLPDHGFAARVGDQVVHARTVLLATGVEDLRPQVPGLDRLWDEQVLRFCPICDGFDFADQRIGVIGRGAHAVRETLFLRRYSDKLSFIGLPGEAGLDEALEQQLADSHVSVVVAPISHLHRLPGHGVRMTVADGSTHDFDALYVAYGAHVRSELALALGAEADDKGGVITDARGRTSVPDLYAAGDVVSGLDQISVGCGHAAVAATAIHNALAAA